MTERTQLGTRVSQVMANEIKQLVEEGRYLNTADFLRAAARDKLEKELEAVEMED